MSNSFTIRVKCASIAYGTSGATLDGFCCKMDDSNSATPTAIAEGGELISGTIPSWFRGITTFGSAGMLLFTNQEEDITVSEAVGGEPEFSVSVNGGVENYFSLTAGSDQGSIADTEGLPFAGRFYYSAHYVHITDFSDAVVSGDVVEITINTFNADGLANKEIVNGNCLGDIVKPLGFDRGTQIVNSTIEKNYDPSLVITLARMTNPFGGGDTYYGVTNVTNGGWFGQTVGSHNHRYYQLPDGGIRQAPNITGNSSAYGTFIYIDARPENLPDNAFTSVTANGVTFLEANGNRTTPSGYASYYWSAPNLNFFGHATAPAVGSNVTITWA